MTLSDDEEKRVRALLRCTKGIDPEDLGALLKNAKTVEEVLKAAKALGMVGRIVRQIIIWIAGFIIAATAINAALKTGIRGWLG